MVLQTEDVSLLFSKLTVKEIQKYERKTRAEIEKRKEDLRVMVGERYRDLIEAADTIRDMKLSVESVSQHVKNMHDSSIAMDLKKTPVKPALPSLSMIQQQCYSVAARVKLLLDIPDKIWISLENGDLLDAANLYLLAQHIHTSLEIEVNHQDSVPISTCFPVVARQWASVMHFRSSILLHSQQTMKAGGIEARKMAECLCAIMCITDCSSQKLCSDFLLARMASLEDILSPNQQVANVKDQIVALINQIKETVILTCSIFHRDNTVLFPNKGSGSGGLLYDVLETIKDTKKCDLLQLAMSHETVWAKYLPSSLVGFCPVFFMTANTVSLTEDFLQETCNHWIKVVKDTLTSGVSHILSYVNSVKGLSIIQDAIRVALVEITQDNKWTDSCERLMHKKISLWEDFLSSLFVFRIKAIVEGQFNGIVKSTKQNIILAINEINSVRPSELENDISSFIWTEGPEDIPSKFSLEGAAGRRLDMDNLTMKARGFTPRVQSICCSLDIRLKNILEDVGFYVKSSTEFSLKLSINTELDLEHIQCNLQSGCCGLVDSLVDYMELALSNFSSDPAGNSISVSKALLLAYLCTAMTELCPHLQKGIKGINTNYKSTLKDPQQLFLTSTKKSQKQNDNPLWQSVKQKLLEEKLELYGFWNKVVDEELKSKLKALVPIDVSDIFKHMPQWDLIEIEEESEEGTSVKSTISVPMHPSRQMESLLYWLCYEVNKIGGHIIPRVVLEDVQLNLLNRILATYESYLKTVDEQKLFMPQAVGLQLLFDARFVTGLISPRDKELCDRIQIVCDDFERFIDPFDLDVFSPYINNHLKRCIQRSLVLLGPLTSSDRLSVYNSSRPAYLSHEEQHNVLCLSAGQRIRFTLLPVGSASVRNIVQKDALTTAEEKPRQVLVNKGEKSRSISPQRSPNVAPVGATKSASASFFGAMSSSWFGN